MFWKRNVKVEDSGKIDKVILLNYDRARVAKPL